MKNKNTFFISLFFAFMLLCQLSYAEIISVEKAQLVAKNVYFERLSLVNEEVTFKSIKFKDAIVIKSNSLPMYYAFNCISGTGYIIVAAESNAMPVLSYSFETDFNADNMNEAVTEIMENYLNEIMIIRDKNLQADDVIISEWAKYSVVNFQKSVNDITTVGPLLKTKWNQSCYYNTLCPSSSSAPYGYCSHVPSGCVSIVMAQIMKYWSFPATGLGSNAYASMGNHNVNFGAQNYNWAAMPLELTTENAEVSKIIYHAGVSVNMNYTPNGSGAATANAVEKFKYNFKYSSAAQYVTKGTGANAIIAWDILIRSNLIDGRPVIYSGRTTSDAGHAFILDGFQYHEYYHINWGWGGNHDGYFYLNNLNSGNGNYSLEQSAIINLYPSTVTTSPLGIEESNLASGVKIAPNPNNGNFSLLINNAVKGNITVTVMDIASRVILKKTINKQLDIITEEMMLPELTQGFYYVAVEGNQFKSVNKFIVK